MLISTGVQRSLFPGYDPSNPGNSTGLAARIGGTANADTTDAIGYGTWAASTLLQLLGDVTITSRNVMYTTNVVDFPKLKAALDEVKASPSAYEVVLLALNPGWVPEPAAYLMAWNAGRVDYDPDRPAAIIGSQWDLALGAVLRYPGVTGGGQLVPGIPLEPALRNRVFTLAKGKERTAVELAASQHQQWTDIGTRLSALQSQGVPVIVPAGDAPTSGDCSSETTCRAAAGQRVIGVAAGSNVLTVGASYLGTSLDCAAAQPGCSANPFDPRVSPVSARGPTLDQRLKPDVLAPSDVVGLVPASSTVGQALPAAPSGATLQWRPPGSPSCNPGPCYTGAGKLLLEGSSHAAAAVAAAQIGRLVAGGWPEPASLRTPTGTSQAALVLRGYAWAKAGGNGVLSSLADGTRAAFAWEQGAGSLQGLIEPPLPAAVPPIPLAPFTVREVGWGGTQAVQATIPLWAAGALPTSAASTVGGFFGGTQDGLAAAVSYSDPVGGPSVGATATGAAVTLTAARGQFQGGLYTGSLTLGSYTFPFEVQRTLTLKFFARYPFVSAGEFVEDSTVSLVPALPSGLAPTGALLKYVPPVLGNIRVRYANTRNVSPWDATIENVAPGSYAVMLLQDHGMSVDNPDDRAEGVAPGLSEGSPPARVYLGSLPSCDLDQPQTVLGPLSLGGSKCVNASLVIQEYGTSLSASLDPRSRLCVEVGATTAGQDVTLNAYCGGATLLAPTGLVSRAIHLPVSGDFKRCGVEIPPGVTTSLDSLIGWAQGSACTQAVTTNPTPSGWRWNAHADNCGSDDPPTIEPTSLTSDSNTARYSGSSTAPLQSLPATVLKYDFALGWPNVSADITVSFGYHLENALLVLYVQAGDVTPNTIAATLVTDSPGVTTDLVRKGTTGSVGWHTGILSTGAYTGTLNFLVIPTTAVSTPLGEARFEVCNLGMRFTTFAKQAYTDPVGGLQSATIRLTTGTGANDLLAQTTPSYCKTRKSWNQNTEIFSAISPVKECEQVWAGFEVPKNDSTTNAPTDIHHTVKSETPTHLTDLVSGTYSLKPTMIARAATIHDPVRGVRTDPCAFEPDDPLCVAKRTGRTIIQLDVLTNGRFYSTFPVEDQDIRLTSTSGGAVKGVVTAVVSDSAGAPFTPADPPTATPLPYPRCTGLPSKTCRYYSDQLDPVTNTPLSGQQGYVPSPPVGVFYTPELHPELNSFSSDVSAGDVTISQSGSTYTLTVAIRSPDLGTHTVQTNLNCITIDGGALLCA